MTVSYLLVEEGSPCGALVLECRRLIFVARLGHEDHKEGARWSAIADIDNSLARGSERFEYLVERGYGGYRGGYDQHEANNLSEVRVVLASLPDDDETLHAHTRAGP